MLEQKEKEQKEELDKLRLIEEAYYQRLKKAKNLPETDSQPTIQDSSSPQRSPTLVNPPTQIPQALLDPGSTVAQEKRPWLLKRPTMVSMLQGCRVPRGTWSPNPLAGMSSTSSWLSLMMRRSRPLRKESRYLGPSVAKSRHR